MKEGGLFNVQPMSKWDTIFFFLKEERRGGGRGGCVVGVWEDAGWKCR